MTKDHFNERTRRVRQELEPYRKSWGGYIFRLYVEQTANKALTVSSPDLNISTATFQETTLADVDTVTQGFRISLGLNFDLGDADIYYAKTSGPHWELIDGDDELLGLAPGKDYEMIVVPKGTLQKKLATIPKGIAPRGACVIRKPAF